LSHHPGPSGRAVHGEVDGLFFCATLTGCRGGHTPFVETGAETSDTGVEAVELDPGSSWEVIAGGGYWCLELKWSLVELSAHSIDDLPTATYVFCCQKNS